MSAALDAASKAAASDVNATQAEYNAEVLRFRTFCDASGQSHWPLLDEARDAREEVAFLAAGAT